MARNTNVATVVARTSYVCAADKGLAPPNDAEERREKKGVMMVGDGGSTTTTHHYIYI